MKHCPYCGTSIGKHKDVCKSQACINLDVEALSLKYPPDSEYVHNDYNKVDNAFRYPGEGRQRTRHEHD